ncbi:MAG TPA: zinc ribbon domain-containing protein [Candidatus Omnitrophica bacterium]|nr:zinc ribbon domain-containing protein [Candidatus Omnitrophota bacterium]
MPIYTYFCKKCDRKFDLLIKNSKDIPQCPDYKNKDLEKLFSPFAIYSQGRSTSSKCSSCSAKNCSTCS